MEEATPPSTSQPRLPEANAARAVSVPQDLQDHLDLMVTMAKMDSPDKTETPEKTPHPRKCPPPTTSASTAPPDHQDHLEIQDPRDHPDSQDRTDNQASQDSQETQAPLDHPDHQEWTETQDSQEPQDSPDKSERFQDKPDLQDPQDPKDHQEATECQETQETQDKTVNPEHPETPERTEPQETQDSLAPKARTAPMESLAAALTAHHPEPHQDIKLEIRISNSYRFKLHEPYFLVLYNPDQVFHLLTRFLISTPSISISSAKNHRRLQTMGLLFFFTTHIFRLPKFRPIPP